MVSYVKADNGKGLGYCNGCSVPGYKVPARTGKWAQNVKVRRLPGGEICSTVQPEPKVVLEPLCQLRSEKQAQLDLRHKTWQSSNATRWSCEDVSETHIRLKDMEGKYLTRGAERTSLDGNLIMSLAWNATASAPQLWTVTTW
ncbi:hypothetical protein SDRG_12212 [Saprolegnia diclina VS20]|uniref:Uncharacterized protein n=1 Tax=Saprolegnia diclina (strain VS20) TaxID=1156394 RepID=T0PX96_SAPDV|nr:hypothetical protein SDRG_12212 [Saprolegnia diclina VS20]EQC30154.1 hypothetical protein SDRG_12212 [Saprolegnia diclina VS20]|eukprot:XP_008616497.1 hypothetical protein SDRG_12212 [Saprolegnia diclina VS20]